MGDDSTQTRVEKYRGRERKEGKPVCMYEHAASDTKNSRNTRNAEYIYNTCQCYKTCGGRKR